MRSTENYALYSWLNCKVCVRVYARSIEKISQKHYPQTKHLKSTKENVCVTFVVNHMIDTMAYINIATDPFQWNASKTFVWPRFAYNKFHFFISSGWLANKIHDNKNKNSTNTQYTLKIIENKRKHRKTKREHVKAKNIEQRLLVVVLLFFSQKKVIAYRMNDTQRVNDSVSCQRVLMQEMLANLGFEYLFVVCGAWVILILVLWNAVKGAFCWLVFSMDHLDIFLEPMLFLLLPFFFFSRVYRPSPIWTWIVQCALYCARARVCVWVCAHRTCCADCN